MSISGLQIGDVVRLKSGGPDMVVLHLNPYTNIDVLDCQWFDVFFRCQTKAFESTVLEKVEA